MPSRSLPDVLAADDRRASLEALRAHLGETLLVTEPARCAPLAKELREVLRELDELSVPEVSASDELKLAREARRGIAAKVPERAAKRGKRSG